MADKFTLTVDGAPTFYMTKAAWIRDKSVPAGQSALGQLNCPCGQAPQTAYKPEQGNITCGCGAVYTWDGWIIKRP